MKDSLPEKKVARRARSFEWVFEVLLVVSITPALIYGVSSLSQLPIA